MPDMSILWFIAIVGGPIALGLVIAYAEIKRRRLSPGEKARQERATHALYEEEDRKAD